MFNSIKSWLKLRADRRAQKRCLDQQVHDLMALHRPVMERYSFSPMNGRRLCWKVEPSGKSPFDPRTGLPSELTIRVSVSEKDTYKNRAQYKYNYDVPRRTLQYRDTDHYSYDRGWKDVPEI